MAKQNGTDANLVEERHACPDCGERDVDKLVWVDDIWVECLTCGRLYEP